MKNLLLSVFLFCFSFGHAQNMEAIEDFFKMKKGSVAYKMEAETPEGEKFQYDHIKLFITSEEIQQIFHIPDSIAAKYPLQVIYLMDYIDMETISAEEIIGITTYSINPQRIKQQFFRNEKLGWKEDKNYGTNFHNDIFCSSYQVIFDVEVAKTDYLKNNPAYILIYNKDREIKFKSDQEKFVSQAYFAALGIPATKNHIFLKIKKQAEVLGFTHELLEEKQGISTP